MRIVYEQTDTQGGLLTLEDDAGRQKRYVRRKRRLGLTHVVDLIQPGTSPLQFAPGHRVDAAMLPEQVVVCQRSTPSEESPRAHFEAEFEYWADERAFWIWEKFRDKTMRESGTLDALEVKRLLDMTDPQPARPWTVKEVEQELVKWARDKGEA